MSVMMRASIVLALAGILVLADVASAVPPPRSLNDTGGRHSRVSPYLSLATGTNYFTFVQPVINQRATNQRTQARLRQLQRSVQTFNTNQRVREGEAIRSTGASASFMNYGGYFRGLN